MATTGGSLAGRAAKARQNTGVGARRGGFALTRPITQEEAAKGVEKKAPPRGGWILFWLVVGIAIAKDLVDVFSAILDLIAAGLSLAVVTAPIGIPIGVLAEFIDKITGLLIDLVMGTYFALIGGRFAMRLVVLAIGSIIDAIPFLNVLPLTTITFVAAFFVGRVLSSGTGGKVMRIVNIGKKALKFV